MMRLARRAWNKLTYTKALEQSSGKMETLFFESVYRVTYLTGFSSADRNISYLLYSYAVKLSVILIFFSELWFFFSVSWNLDGIIDSVNIILIQLCAMYKYKNLVSCSHVFKDLASAMESPYFDITTNERKNLLDLWQKRNESYLWLLIGLGTSTLIAWHTYPLLDDLEYNLMVSVRLPYEYDTTSKFIPTYCAVLVMFSYIAYFVMINDVIMQSHIMFLLCQFAVLEDCFKNILYECCNGTEDLNDYCTFMTDKFQHKYLKNLRHLVKQHQFILNNVSVLKAILSGPMLAQIAVSTILMCSIGYQAATNVENVTKLVMSLLYLGYNMVVLYIICRWCEEIKTQSANIGQAVYCSGWECGIASARGVRASLLLIIARANKPLVLSAGGMYDLSLDTYTNLVKSSYSALTVLLGLHHD